MKLEDSSMTNTITAEHTVLSAIDYKSAPLMLDVHDEVLDTEKLRGKIQVLSAKVGEVDDQLWGVGDSIDVFLNPYWEEYANQAKDLGVPLVAYLFDNPAYKRARQASPLPNDEDPQIRLLRKAFSKNPPVMLAIDVERYWSDYNQWYKFLRKETTEVDVISESWIVKSVTDLCQRIGQDQDRGDLPLFDLAIYSGPGFVSTYAPSLVNVLAKYANWIATYPTNLSSKLAYLASITDLREKAWPTQGSRPVVVGSKPADIWQFGGNAIFADCSVVDRNTKKPCSVDVNIVLNPLLFLDKVEVLPTPVAKLDPKKQSVYAKLIRNANMRRTASVTDNKPVLLLPVGTELEIIDTIENTEGVWRVARIKGDFIIADNVNGVKYLDTPTTK